MAARLILLPAGSAVELYPANTNVVEAAKVSAPIQWTGVTTSLVRAAAGRAPLDIDVFLCLTGDGISTTTGRHEATTLLRQARDACWGAPVYLAVGKRAGSVTQIRRDDGPLFEWLAGAARARAHDLLRVQFDDHQDPSLLPPRLRQACDETNERRRVLAALAGWDSWRYLIHRRGGVIQTEPPIALSQDSGATADQGDNLIVAIDPTVPFEHQRRVIERMRRDYPDREYLVVTLRHSPGRHLEMLCKTLGIYGPLKFSSEIELWYFLARLNDTPWPTPQAVHADARRVAPRAPQSFRRPPAPVVLVTHSFSPGEASLCRDAAGDVGVILAAMSADTAFHADIAVTPARLSTLLESLPNVSAWVHMGHGSAPDHLRAADGDSVPPERWLACFTGREFPLSLAVFLSCHSVEVARLFARAGTRLAIGFDREVVSESCRLLAREVLGQWLRTPLDVTRALGAYAKGSNAVISDNGGAARAFVPRR